jgi:hypothetical protein
MAFPTVPSSFVPHRQRGAGSVAASMPVASCAPYGAFWQRLGATRAEDSEGWSLSLSTLIVLTAEQVELVRHGVLSDSTFQPMPASVVSSFDSSNEYRRRDRRVTGKRGVGNRHQIESLDRDVAAKHWKQLTVELAMLIGNADTPGHSPGSAWTVIALARASALGRKGSGTTGVRRLEIRDWHLLPAPVLVEDIVGELPPNEARWWRENLHTSCKPIPPSTNDATLRALRSRVPNFDEIATAVLRPPAFAGGVDVATRPSLQEARDASMTAMRVFSPDWRDLRSVSSPQDQRRALQGGSSLLRA